MLYRKQLRKPTGFDGKGIFLYKRKQIRQVMTRMTTYLTLREEKKCMEFSMEGCLHTGSLMMEEP